MIEHVFAPLDVFKSTVRYFPMPSMNLLIRNEHGEYLYVLRRNQPAKDMWWVPGGRLLNGETMRQACDRLLQGETGVRADILKVSDRVSEELWSTEGYTSMDFTNYDPATACIHYWACAALVQVQGEPRILLDAQSSEAQWFREPPHNHPYLQKYWEILELPRTA